MVRAFYLSNVEAKQAGIMLKTVLKLKDVYVDDKYNLLILRESADTIALAEKLIRLHDLEEPEVMLDVEVLEVNRSRLLNAGVQWSGQLTATVGSQDESSSAGAMTLSALRKLTPGALAITVPSATINLQKIDGDAKLLANPRIRVRDREKAKIMIGDKVPVVTTTSTNNYVAENIQYLDVGLKLEVEPDIHLRDEVGLKLGLEVSALVSSMKTASGTQAYQIGTRNVTSALRLKDGETQILAGLISDEDRSSATKIPLIGDLPLAGRLFGSRSDTRQKTEIILSITPHLVRNIQRREPASEAFWSGTEASLRDKPLVLGGAALAAAQGSDTPAKQPYPAPAAAVAAAVAGAPATGGDPNAPRLTWVAPPSAKVGQDVTIYLDADSPEALRAGSLQLGYSPALLELVDADDGGYFDKNGKAAFSKTIDHVNGRLSVGINGKDAAARGQGRLLALKFKPKAPGEAEISVISMMAIGASKAIGKPALPLTQRLPVAQ
jgi:general secretion pathway protein D